MNPLCDRVSSFPAPAGYVTPMEPRPLDTMHTHHTSDLHATASRLDLAVKILACALLALGGLAIRLILRR